MRMPCQDPEIQFLSNLRDTFRFECQACGACCGAFTILLSPYDILRLRKATRASTTKLIERGIYEIRRESFRRMFGFGPVADFLDVFGIARDDTVPVAVLQFRDNGNKKECHFLEEPHEGKRLCGIYENRPTMCRLHPLGCTAVNGKRAWFFRRPLCDSGSEKRQTVGQWISSSGCKPFLAANAQFLKWMLTLINSATCFVDFPDDQRANIERILYDFDSIRPQGRRPTFQDIGRMFDHSAGQAVRRKHSAAEPQPK